MGRYFEENYDLLRSRLAEMSDLVERVVDSSLAALKTRDVERARRVIDEDERIDTIEIEIDESVLRLLALQQPMAIDLRFLMTALKVTNDLERMGDQATNIARGVIELSGQQAPETPDLIDFGPMGAAVVRMAKGAISAYASGDVELAREIVRSDDQVDAMHRGILKSLAVHLRTHPEHADRCLNLMLVTRNLERIADLATNVGEEVVYYVEGKIIKHMH